MRINFMTTFGIILGVAAICGLIYMLLYHVPVVETNYTIHSPTHPELSLIFLANSSDCTELAQTMIRAEISDAMCVVSTTKHFGVLGE